MPAKAAGSICDVRSPEEWDHQLRADLKSRRPALMGVLFAYATVALLQRLTCTPKCSRVSEQAGRLACLCASLSEAAPAAMQLRCKFSLRRIRLPCTEQSPVGTVTLKL